VLGFIALLSKTIEKPVLITFENSACTSVLPFQPNNRTWVVHG
jgi:hypothetical protein